MNGPTTSLAQLRDIHMPTLIAWWPLAIGWWVVAGLILLILVSVIYYNWRRQQQKPLRHVLAMLAKLQQQQTEQPNMNCLPALSTIMHRIALVHFPRTNVTHLHNDAWLRFLDHTGHTTAFTQGAGQCLAIGPYQKHVDVNWQAVFACVTQWVKTVYV